jgi:thymidine kinase
MTSNTCNNTNTPSARLVGPNYRGEIHIYLGGMFAKKTSKLIEEYREHIVKKEKCLIIKYNNDIRYDKNGISTHDHLILEKDVVISGKKLFDVHEKCVGFDFVGIDEGQFYDDLPEFAEKLANEGKTVVIASLDGDFRREKFGRTLELIPKAEIVKKLHGICDFCRKNQASFSKLIKAEHIVDGKTQEIIGGADTYKAVCRECYFNKQ